MMYSNKLAVAVKANGKVLREFNKDTVMVPFGSEYTILIKNLNNVRAQIRVEIDGQDATENVSLVIQPNSEIELTRFIKNGNLNVGNRFKFIERTAGIEQHRGIGVEDGLIRIEYQFEVQPVVTQAVTGIDWLKQYHLSNQPRYFTQDTWTASSAEPELMCKSKGMRSVTRGSSMIGAAASAPVMTNYCSTATADSYSMNTTLTSTAQSFNDVGITVPGSVSDQKFNLTSNFSVEWQKHVMVIKLVGETEQGVRVTKAVTVKAKPKCVTCGKQNKANAKFCSECGTSLTIV